MFNLLGPVDEKAWPNFSSLPDAKRFDLHTKITHPEVHLMFPENRLSRSGLDLFLKLMCYNPDNRTSARDALNHQYWQQTPQMKDTDLMPTFPSRSDGRKTRKF